MTALIRLVVRVDRCLTNMAARHLRNQARIDWAAQRKWPT